MQKVKAYCQVMINGTRLYDKLMQSLLKLISKLEPYKWCLNHHVPWLKFLKVEDPW